MGLDEKMLIQGKEQLIDTDLPVRVTCLEHVERELDDYVDNYQVAPDMYPLEEVEAEGISRQCDVCGEAGKIVLLHVKGM